jgi:hypothetical protein
MTNGRKSSVLSQMSNTNSYIITFLPQDAESFGFVENVTDTMKFMKSFLFSFIIHVPYLSGLTLRAMLVTLDVTY